MSDGTHFLGTRTCWCIDRLAITHLDPIWFIGKESIIEKTKLFDRLRGKVVGAPARRSSLSWVGCFSAHQLERKCRQGYLGPTHLSSLYRKGAGVEIGEAGKNKDNWTGALGRTPFDRHKTSRGTKDRGQRTEVGDSTSEEAPINYLKAGAQKPLIGEPSNHSELNFYSKLECFMGIWSITTSGHIGIAQVATQS